LAADLARHARAVLADAVDSGAYAGAAGTVDAAEEEPATG
jgi:hypothetical protein